MVRALIVSSQLGFEIIKREEVSFIVKTFLIFSVAPFYLSIMSGGIGFDPFMFNVIQL